MRNCYKSCAEASGRKDHGFVLIDWEGTDSGQRGEGAPQEGGLLSPEQKSEENLVRVVFLKMTSKEGDSSEGGGGGLKTAR